MVSDLVGGVGVVVFVISPSSQSDQIDRLNRFSDPCTKFNTPDDDDSSVGGFKTLFDVGSSTKIKSSSACKIKL